MSTRELHTVGDFICESCVLYRGGMSVRLSSVDKEYLGVNAERRVI